MWGEVTHMRDYSYLMNILRSKAMITASISLDEGDIKISLNAVTGCNSANEPELCFTHFIPSDSFKLSCDTFDEAVKAKESLKCSFISTFTKLYTKILVYYMGASAKFEAKEDTCILANIISLISCEDFYKYSEDDERYHFYMNDMFSIVGNIMEAKQVCA